MRWLCPQLLTRDARPHVSVLRIGALHDMWSCVEEHVHRRRDCSDPTSPRHDIDNTAVRFRKRYHGKGARYRRTSARQPNPA